MDVFKNPVSTEPEVPELPTVDEYIKMILKSDMRMICKLVDETLRLREENSGLAAGQCIEPGCLVGDDYGNAYCKLRKEVEACRKINDRLDRCNFDEARHYTGMENLLLETERKLEKATAIACIVDGCIERRSVGESLARFNLAEARETVDTERKLMEAEDRATKAVEALAAERKWQDTFFRGITEISLEDCGGRDPGAYTDRINNVVANLRSQIKDLEKSMTCEGSG